MIGIVVGVFLLVIGGWLAAIVAFKWRANFPEYQIKSTIAILGGSVVLPDGTGGIPAAVAISALFLLTGGVAVLKLVSLWESFKASIPGFAVLAMSAVGLWLVWF